MQWVMAESGVNLGSFIKTDAAYLRLQDIAMRPLWCFAAENERRKQNKAKQGLKDAPRAAFSGQCCA
jgi:hypothetical protein